jgi:oxygen-independent coproporphyrinogen-3 oxidase
MSPLHPPARPACEPAEAEPATGNYFVSAYPPFSTWTPGELSAVHTRLERAPASPPEVPLGLYVHIPFCIRRCDYCYYLSYAGKAAADMDAYVACLIREMELYRASPALAGRHPAFLYVGGGTPSLLPEQALARLLAGLAGAFPRDRIRETTFECAPRSVTREKLRLLRQWGITRISLGVQELDDEVLRRNGRVHLVADCHRAVAAIRQAGFDTLNIDLIAGLVGQTDDSFLASLDRVIDMQPECVTIYLLEIPHNTPLYRHLAAGPPAAWPAAWELKRARLAAGFARLEAAGYTRRSAYAAVRDPTRHRFDYQDLQYGGADLLGFGASAFSYLDGIHFQNLARIGDYERALRAGRLPLLRACVLGDEERLVREFVLQLKLGAIDVARFRRKFGVDVCTRFAVPLAELRRQGWLTMDKPVLRLTREGLLRVDRLLPEFYLDRHRSAG